MRTSSGASKRLRITVTRFLFTAWKTSNENKLSYQHFEDQSVHVSSSCNKVLYWLQRLVRPWSVRRNPQYAQTTVPPGILHGNAASSNLGTRTENGASKKRRRINNRTRPR